MALVQLVSLQHVSLPRFGYSVTIFEAEKKAGGLNTYGIVSFRFPNDFFWEVEQVVNFDVDIKTNIRVGVDILLRKLAQYDAVILAIGMGDVPNL